MKSRSCKAVDLFHPKRCAFLPIRTFICTLLLLQNSLVKFLPCGSVRLPVVTIMVTYSNFFFTNITINYKKHMDTPLRDSFF